MKAIICGANGAMGKLILARLSQEVTGLVSLDGENGVCKTFTDLGIVEADVIIDFSHHSAIADVLAYGQKIGAAVVIGATGHTEEEMAALKRLSEEVAVFHSGNMSVGINLLISLCKTVSASMGDKADIEIIEKHHNQKLDAPSGTALMIANAIREAHPCETEIVYDRTARRSTRPKTEIGISAIRGGNIVGEHEVMFCMGNEIVTIKHSAIGRALFAEGALRAAEFMKGKTSGFYSMEDLLKKAVSKSAVEV